MSAPAACCQAGPRRYEFVNALIEAGATFDDGPIMAVHRGALQSLEARPFRASKMPDSGPDPATYAAGIRPGAAADQWHMPDANQSPRNRS